MKVFSKVIKDWFYFASAAEEGSSFNTVHAELKYVKIDPFTHVFRQREWTEHAG